MKSSIFTDIFHFSAILHGDPLFLPRPRENNRGTPFSIPLFCTFYKDMAAVNRQSRATFCS